MTKQSENPVCDICKKSFSRKSNLREHIKIHLGRKFICPHCGEAQTTKHSNIRHIQRAHPLRKIRNVDENERYTQNNEEVFSEGAKDALIARLSKKLLKKRKSLRSCVAKSKKINKASSNISLILYKNLFSILQNVEEIPFKLIIIFVIACSSIYKFSLVFLLYFGIQLNMSYI